MCRYIICRVTFTCHTFLFSGQYFGTTWIGWYQNGELNWTLMYRIKTYMSNIGVKTSDLT